MADQFVITLHLKLVMIIRFSWTFFLLLVTVPYLGETTF